MTPREIFAWASFAQDAMKSEDALRLQLAAVAAQGDAKSIDRVVKTLLDGN